jgi:hypothetical protein
MLAPVNKQLAPGRSMWFPRHMKNRFPLITGLNNFNPGFQTNSSWVRSNIYQIFASA